MEVTIGDRIKKIRELQRYSGTEFAELIGISKQNLSDLENNKIKNVKPDVLKLLKEKFNVSSDYILFGDGEMFKGGAESTYTKKIINGDNNVVAVGNNGSNFTNNFGINAERMQNNSDTITLQDIKKISDYNVQQKLLNEFGFIKSTIQAFLQTPSLARY